MTKPDTEYTDVHFRKMEEAVLATDQGRWFLTEFARRNKVADTAEVLGAIADLKVNLTEAQNQDRYHQLQDELREMARSISDAKTEFADLNNEALSAEPISSATFELDAIVDATEQATSSILAAAEELQSIAEVARDQDDIKGFCEEVERLASDIFTACSFQDLTGQRLTKVVETLRFLEQRVDDMIEGSATSSPDVALQDQVDGPETFEAEETSQGPEPVTAEPTSAEAVSEDDLDVAWLMEDAAPGDPTPGFSQREIDALLANAEPESETPSVPAEEVSQSVDGTLRLLEQLKREGPFDPHAVPDGERVESADLSLEETWERALAEDAEKSEPEAPLENKWSGLGSALG